MWYDFECRRCGHKWDKRWTTPKTGPKVCPSCKSRLWRKPVSKKDVRSNPVGRPRTKKI